MERSPPVFFRPPARDRRLQDRREPRVWSIDIPVWALSLKVIVWKRNSITFKHASARAETPFLASRKLLFVIPSAVEASPRSDSHTLLSFRAESSKRGIPPGIPREIPIDALSFRDSSPRSEARTRGIYAERFSKSPWRTVTNRFASIPRRARNDNKRQPTFSPLSLERAGERSSPLSANSPGASPPAPAPARASPDRDRPPAPCPDVRRPSRRRSARSASRSRPL